MHGYRALTALGPNAASDQMEAEVDEAGVSER